MSHAAQFDQWVPFPVEQVFLFFANPENLPRLMPPGIGARLERLTLVPPPDPPGAATLGATLAGVGSLIVTSFRVLPPLPFRAQWFARITEFEWNDHFADVQERGPFKTFHHRHEFSAHEKDGVHGAIVRDCLAYDIGFGTAGSLVQHLFIQHQLASAFHQRQLALPALLSQPTRL